MNLIPFITNHLFILITLSFAFGIGASSKITLNPPLSFLLLFLFGSGLLVSHLARKIWATHVLLLGVFVLLGLMHGTLAAEKPHDPSHIYNLTLKQKEVVLIGVLHSLPGFNGERSKIIIKLTSLRFEDSHDFIKSTGLVRLSMREKWPDHIKAGDLVAVRARLGRPRGFQNPGTFNYGQFLSRKNIWITGTIRSPLHVARINRSPTLFNTIRYLPERLRSKISDTIDQSVSPHYSPLYKAVLIGDRSAVDKNTLELFKKTGCMHILAISGLHMGIISAILFITIYWLSRRSEWLMLHIPGRKTAALLCLLPLALYTLIAGGNTPVIRSFLMSTVIITALCVNRRKQALTILALAALLILIMNPTSLFSASFQLSFAAVASIGAVIPIITQLLNQNSDIEKRPTFLHKCSAWLFTALIISISATVGTLPLLLYHFNRISLVGPVANLLVEPLICLWSLVLGFIAIPLIFIAPTLAMLLFKLGSIGFYLAIEILQVIDRFPYASIYLPTPSTVLLFCYFLSLFILFYPQKKFIRLTGSAGLIVTLLFFFHTPGNLLAGDDKKSIITYLDVGHGSSTLIQFPGNKTVLIDGGALTSKEFNIGKQVIAPFLWQKGIKHLDGVVITHTDSDHYNGLGFILEHFRPAIVWTSSIDTHSNSYSHLLNLARKLGIEVTVPLANQLFINTESAKISCFAHPMKNALSSNDRGLIIRYQHGQFSCLFPGDISSIVEKHLVARDKPLAATILLSPHHGSATSNSDIFLQNVHPSLLIISNGRRLLRHSQINDLLKRCNQLGITIETTHHAGAITVESDGKDFNLDRFID